jgi:hypothetical protein
MFAESMTAIVLTDWRMRFTRFHDFKGTGGCRLWSIVDGVVVDRFAGLSWNIPANAR